MPFEKQGENILCKSLFLSKLTVRKGKSGHPVVYFCDQRLQALHTTQTLPCSEGKKTGREPPVPGARVENRVLSEGLFSILGNEHRVGYRGIDLGWSCGGGRFLVSVFRQTSMDLDFN